MGRGDYLGEFEQVVLLSVAALGENAYGMRVRDHIEERGGRSVSVPTVYSALDRLERKGLLESSLGDPTRERGGRARKTFRVTAGGAGELQRSRTLLRRMWEGAEDALEGLS